MNISDPNQVKMTAVEVSVWFLERAKRDYEYMSLLKLVKLCIIAHGFHLALNKSPLFDDAIVKQKYGPSIPSVMEHFVEYGAGPISRWKDYPVKVDRETSFFLEDVYYKYCAHLTTVQLSGLINSPGLPWYAARIGTVVNDEDIEEYYSNAVEYIKNREKSKGS